MRRLSLFAAMCLVICVPLVARAQVTDLDTWIDTDFDGLPANTAQSMDVKDIDSVAIYVDLTGFPAATWTNFLYYFSLGPGPDSTTNFFDSDTADVGVRYAVSGGAIFPEDNFNVPNLIGIGGQGFNTAVVNGPALLAVVSLRAIRPTSTPGSACIVPTLPSVNAYFFCQFGNGAAYGLFNTGVVTQGCLSISPLNATEATSWGRLKGLYR